MTTHRIFVLTENHTDRSARVVHYRLLPLAERSRLIYLDEGVNLGSGATEGLHLPLDDMQIVHLQRLVVARYDMPAAGDESNWLRYHTQKLDYGAVFAWLTKLWTWDVMHSNLSESGEWRSSDDSIHIVMSSLLGELSQFPLLRQGERLVSNTAYYDTYIHVLQTLAQHNVAIQRVYAYAIRLQLERLRNNVVAQQFLSSLSPDDFLDNYSPDRAGVMLKNARNAGMAHSIFQASRRPSPSVIVAKVGRRHVDTGSLSVVGVTTYLQKAHGLDARVINIDPQFDSDKLLRLLGFSSESQQQPNYKALQCDCCGLEGALYFSTTQAVCGDCLRPKETWVKQIVLYDAITL
jgi:hypothetical protein